MKNKFISLACVVAMMMSIFSAFNFVSADNAQTMTAKATLKGDNAEIVVSYSGMTEVSALNFYLPLDPTVFDTTGFVAKNNVNKNETFSGALANLSGNDLRVGWSFVDEYASSSSDILTVTVPVKDKTKLPFEIELTMVSVTDEQESGAVTYGTADQKPDQQITLVNAVLTDPDAPTPKPTSPARPTKAPVVDPTAAPTYEPVTEGQRIQGTATVKDGVATITVDYAGMTEVSALNFYLPLDPTVFDTTAFVTKDNVNKNEIFSGALANLSGNDLRVGWSFVDEYAPAESEIITVTVPVKDKTKLPVNIELTMVSVTDEQEGGAVTYGTADQKPNHIIAVNRIEVSETAETPAPTTKPKEVELKDFVGAGAEAAISEAVEASKAVYITVEVKKGNNAAVYGTDYVAVYDGAELSEPEYINLISGYTDKSMVDVINNLKFNVFNSSVNKIATTVNAVGEDGEPEQIVDPIDKPIDTTPTPVPKTPVIKITSSKATATVGDKVTVTAKVTNPATDGELKASYTEDSLDYVTGSGIKIDADTQDVTFTAAVKGTVEITYTYKYTDADGKEQTITENKKIAIKEKSNSGDSSSSGNNNNSSNNNSSGPIARPNVTTSPDYVKPEFNDLGSVAWAEEAIRGLADKGMISGRDQYTFDPNSNITRAEYCQIIIGAINGLGASGQSTYNDVASTDWYYNAVSVASQLGIVSGYGDGNFGPNDLITRQDMAVMTYRAAKVMNVSLEAVNAEIAFADADQVASYAVEAVTSLQKAGIINGMTETTFEPLSNATRAQSAKVIFDTFVK